MMRFRKAALVSSGLIAFIALGAWTFADKPDHGIQTAPADAAESRRAGPGCPALIGIENLEGTRTAHFIMTGSTVFCAIEDATEMDVSTITIHFEPPTATADRFTIWIDSGSGGGTKVIASQQGFGSKILNLGLPLKLRPGDVLTFNSLDSAMGRANIVLHGTPPTQRTGVLAR